MKYALVNGERQEAQPGLTGKCEITGLPVIAKCGTVRSPHWALIGERDYDSWWEPETEWHRKWKAQFPKEYQEVIHFAEDGEKHIADVKTDKGLVIEFQHSHLDPQERVARETFYQNIIWVVDGTRLKGDYPRFLEGRKHLMTGHRKGFFLVHFPEGYFPTAWIESPVMVIFDFQGTQPTDPQDEMRNTLWCLLPGRARRHAVVIGISRQDFVKTVMEQARLLPDPAREYISGYDKLLTKLEEERERQALNQTWRPRRPHRAIIPSRWPISPKDKPCASISVA